MYYFFVDSSAKDNAVIHATKCMEPMMQGSRYRSDPMEQRKGRDMRNDEKDARTRYGGFKIK